MRVVEMLESQQRNVRWERSEFCLAVGADGQLGFVVVFFHVRIDEGFHRLDFSRRTNVLECLADELIVVFLRAALLLRVLVVVRGSSAQRRNSSAIRVLNLFALVVHLRNTSAAVSASDNAHLLAVFVNHREHRLFLSEHSGYLCFLILVGTLLLFTYALLLMELRVVRLLSFAITLAAQCGFRLLRRRLRFVRLRWKADESSGECTLNWFTLLHH